MVPGITEAVLYLKRTKQNWQLQMSQELQDSLVLHPLSFYDCVWGDESVICFQRYRHGAILMGLAHVIDQVFYLGNKMAHVSCFL